MSIPSLLFDTYKQYKLGTSNFSSWLGSTAKKTGLVDDISPALPEVKGKGRLKGKNRTAQRKIDRVYQIRTADFARLAQVVASSTPNAIPCTILQTLKEVIKERKECAGWFASQQTHDADSFETSNEQHRYFIKILEEVHQIITPPNQRGKTNSTDTPASVDAPAEVEKLINIFAHLEVEDPAEETTEPKLSKVHKSSKTAEVFELESSDQDISFAIFCLFKDYTEIRHYIRKVWAEYRDRQIALATAAMTTNTAIAVLRSLNEEFLLNFRNLTTIERTISFLYNGYCDPNGVFEEDPGSFISGGLSLPSKIVFCDSTHEAISAFFQASELPFYQAHKKLRVMEDEAALLKCLSIFGLIAREGGQHLDFDLLIEGLSGVKKTEKIPSWVVLAVQLLVATRRVVGGEGLDRGISEFHKTAEWLSASLQECHNFGIENDVNTWDKVNGGALLETAKRVKLILQDDLIQNLLSDCLGERTKLYNWGPFFLLRNHPMLAGLLTQNFITDVHELAVGLCSDQVAMLATIHLYHAALHKKGLESEWIDFEKMIEWQGSSWVFLGERPQESLMFFRQLSLVTGMSATAFAQDRNGKSTFNSKSRLLPVSKKGVRRLLLAPLYSKLRNAGGKEKVHPGTQRWQLTRARDDPLVMLEMVVIKSLEKQQAILSRASSGSNKRHCKVTPHKLAPLSMIKIFKDCFQEEEIIFRFDLLRLNERCVKLLRKIQKVCVTESPK
jgi:hypothetical protein